MLKRKVIFIVALLFILLSSACGGVADSLFSEPSPTPTAVRNVLATHRVVLPSPIPYATPTVPAPTPAPTVPPVATEAAIVPPTTLPTVPSGEGFCCLQFAAGPYAAAAETFPAGTEIIYAVWDYAGLTPQDRVRRIWIRDNLIWLTRDEKWDWDKYGAAGTVRDLSIFDYEGSGLQPAEYRLQLYLNDELQQEGKFIILSP